MVSLSWRVTKRNNSRQAPYVFPLAGKASGKGSGNWEGGDVSGRRIDRKAVGSTTFFGWFSTATHVTGGAIGVLDSTSDQEITTLHEC